MKTKIIINYFMGIFITIIISLTVLSLILKYFVFNKNYIFNILEKENYYQNVYQEIILEMEDELMPSGLSKDVIKDAFQETEVKQDIIIFVNNVFEGKETILNKEDLNNKIKTNIKEFLSSNNLQITEQNAIDNFTNDLVNIYKNEICLYSYINSLINPFYKVSKIINIGVIMLMILLIIIVITSKKFLKFHYFSSSIIASGLIILFIRLFIYDKIDSEYLLVITENFSDLLTKMIINIGLYLYYAGIALIILGVITSCKVFFKKCQYKNNNR